MKKRYLSLIFLYFLSSCQYFSSPKALFNDVMQSFKVENLIDNNEKYTQHKYGEIRYAKGPNLMLDYAVTINKTKIPIYITGENFSYFKYCSINNVEMKKHIIPSNSNIIKEGNNYLYFDGEYIYKFSNQFELEESIYIDINYDYGYHETALCKKEDSYYLYIASCDTFVIITTDDEFNVISMNIINTNYEYNSITCEQTSYEYEINPFYDESMNQFIMRGYAFGLDESTNSMNTDYYQVLSQPTLINGEYVYKAIKMTDDYLYYDPYHVLNKESDQLLKYKTAYSLTDRKYYDYVLNAHAYNDNDIEVFLQVGRYIGLYAGSFNSIRLEYIKINNDNFSHHFFDEDCFYAGYALKDGTYYHEIVRELKLNVYENENIKYYHFPMQEN